MNYNKLRNDSQKDKTPFILYAFQGATVNFTVKKNTAKDDAEDVDIDLDDDSMDTTTDATAATTATTAGGGLTWDNIFDDWNIGTTSAATGTANTGTTSSTVGTATATTTATATGSGSTQTHTGVSSGLKGLQDLFVKYNVPIRITSDYRAGATTKQGRQSHHATGNAMDIVPLDGHDFAEISKIIRETPEIKNYMQQHGYGVLDETSQDMLARTGGTGAHYHIGPDKIAQNFWNV